MSKVISIIGAGGIGFRHFQACQRLDPRSFKLVVCDMNPAVLQEIQSKVWPVSTECVASVKLLPDSDLVIVATQARPRLAVLRELLDLRRTRNLILEKVLFQKPSEYLEADAFIRKHAIPTWVNCPRRQWPAYQWFRKHLNSVQIQSIQAKSAGWDLGCNGVHYLDLFAYLVGQENYQITRTELTAEMRESKRKGAYWVDGFIEGSFSGISFHLESSQGAPGEMNIQIQTDQGIFQVTEDSSSVRIRGESELLHESKIPYQSELTDLAALDIVQSGTCALSTYTESMKVHLPLLNELLKHFKKLDPQLDHCPIT